MAKQLEPQRVTFESGGVRLVGSLFRPPNSSDPALPGVIVTGSWMTVKEQMPARYARILAEAGFVALTFDFRGFGESDGQPREVESAKLKAQDIRAAVGFLGSQPGVGRIGTLPICASAGYVALAAGSESGIHSIAMVAPWLHDAEIVRAIYGGGDGVSARLERARVARERFEQTGEVEYVRAASNADPTAAMHWPGDALDYYLNPRRGAIPQWGNRFALMAWTEWLSFDAIALAAAVKAPTRLISGEQTATPGGAKAFAARMTAPHDLVMLEGTQFHFYDDPETVGAAANAAIEHFRGTL